MMKWSIKLGRWLGIDVYAHFTFLLLLAFIGLVHGLKSASLAGALGGVLFFASLFLCVLLHEFGHALAARRYGIATQDITLLPIGGLARLDRMPDRPAQELWVAIAGPLVNVAIAALLALWLVVRGQLATADPLSGTEGGLVEKLLTANVFLVVFNLLPAFPMDGGRVLRALLAMRMPHARATSVAAGVGQAMAVLFGFLGLFGNPMLLFIALFVWIGATEESAAAQMKSSLHGYRVRDAMLSDFRTLNEGQTTGDAVKLLLAGSQHDFPVLRDGHPVGLLLRSDMLAALRDQGEFAPIDALVRRDIGSASPDELLEAAFLRVKPDTGGTLPIIENGQLVGLLTAENIGEFIIVRGALDARPGSVPPPLPGQKGQGERRSA